MANCSSSYPMFTGDLDCVKILLIKSVKGCVCCVAARDQGRNWWTLINFGWCRTCKTDLPFMVMTDARCRAEILCSGDFLPFDPPPYVPWRDNGQANPGVGPYRKTSLSRVSRSKQSREQHVLHYFVSLSPIAIPGITNIFHERA